MRLYRLLKRPSNAAGKCDVEQHHCETKYCCKITLKERICGGKQKCKKNTKSVINNTPKPNYCFWSATVFSDKQYTHISLVCLHFPRRAVFRSLATIDQQTRKANVP